MDIQHITIYCIYTNYENGKMKVYLPRHESHQKKILNTYKPIVLLWDIGKQRRPRSDATKRGVRSGSLLFAPRMLQLNPNKQKKTR